MIRWLTFLAVVALACMTVAPLPAQEILSNTCWPQFCGPNALGVSPEEKKLPVHFGNDKAVLWKTAVPPGYSSPCVGGGRMFLTAHDKRTEKLETICLDRNSGRILWHRKAPAEKIEKVHPASSRRDPDP